MSISNKALLVNLSIRQWIGRKKDRQAAETVETSHKTDRNIGNFNKKLLPGAKELQEISRVSGAIRVWYYEQTLPWTNEGQRILASKNYMDFTTQFRQKRAEFDKAVAEFYYRYPKLKQEAQNNLGELYHESEYPDLSVLQDMFDCRIDFTPVPEVQDFRVELSDSEKQNFLDNMRKAETEALKDCWTRLKTVVAKAADKLSAPGAIFRDSLLENVQDICMLLPKLNVTDDPNLEAMRKEVDNIISKIQPDSCRENDQVRNEAAAKLQESLDRMSVFMGK
jgi:hypothetical protein